MTRRAPAHTTVPRGFLTLATVAAAVITVAGLKSISELLAPAFLAVVLTIAAHPLRRFLTSRGVPGWLTTAILVVTVYAVVLSLVLSLVVAVARLAELMPAYQDDLTALVDDTVDRLSALGVEDEQISALAQALTPSQLVSTVAGLLSGLVDVLSNLFFIATLLLFLAVDATWFPDRLTKVAGGRSGMAQALSQFAVGTRRYIAVSTVFGLIVAVLDVGLLYLLGIPLPLLWGLLAFITNYIPNIGFVVGLLPPALLGLLEGGWSGAIAVIAGYSVLNVVIQSVIQPRFVGSAVGLSTSLTFLSLVFWAWVFGPLGALLAIPFSLLARALLVDLDPGSRWVASLLSQSGRPDLESPVQVRLQHNQRGPKGTGGEGKRQTSRP